jgi:pyridoxal/pyridoxine/pyridoxamine kinase
MSFVATIPAALTAASGDLAGIGSVMVAQSAAAAGPTTGVVPAAADLVSALLATQFAAHAQMYQAVGAMAAEVHHLLVSTLAVDADSYAATEAVNLATLG